MKVVEVEWYDSMSAGKWKEKFEVEELIKEERILKSVGYLYTKTHDKLVLVGSCDGDYTFNHYHEIPRKVVKRIRVLK